MCASIARGDPARRVQVLCVCLPTQVNYLNKALDSCQTAIVTPLHYVMFTVLTIVASATLFQQQQSATQMATELCGFLTIVCGTVLLRYSREDSGGLVASLLERSRAAGGGGGRKGADAEEALALLSSGSGVLPQGEAALTMRGGATAAARAD